MFGIKIKAPSFLSKALKSAGTPLKIIGKAAGKIPVVGKPFHAVYDISIAAPFAVVEGTLAGKRIDKVAYENLKRNIKNAQTLAPYAQTVVSLVPGVGTGVSGVIGAANALSKGKPITQALIIGIRDSVPGGPAGKAAFSFAETFMSTGRIDDAALSAVPLSPEQKTILMRAVRATKDIANGKKVDHAIIDQATKALPEAINRSFVIGASVGQAKQLQKLVKVAAPSTVPKFAKIGQGALKNPIFGAGFKAIKGDGAKKGFTVGLGVMSHKMTPAALVSTRKSLSLSQRKGFDLAVAARVGQAENAGTGRTPLASFAGMVQKGLENAPRGIKRKVAGTVKVRVSAKDPGLWEKFLRALGI